MFYLGIDVAKSKLDCLLLVDAVHDKRRAKVVPNSRDGIKTLVQWCTKHGALPAQVHAVMEATDPYHERAARLLFSAGMTVSVANPASVHDFGRTLEIHSKTDTLASVVLARFGAALKPDAWEPPPAQDREFDALVKQMGTLVEDITRLLNLRREDRVSGAPALVESSINNTLDFYSAEMERLEKAITDHMERHYEPKEDSKLPETIPDVEQKASREN